MELVASQEASEIMYRILHKNICVYFFWTEGPYLSLDSPKNLYKVKKHAQKCY